MFEGFTPWHLAIVALVAIMLFGAKRLPDAARSLGRSARILKAEMAGLHGDDAKSVTSQPVTTQPVTTQPTEAARES